MEKRNAENEFRMYTLHSQKGGVGKTSIAIAIAALEQFGRNARPLFLDTDLTGTCILDALGEPIDRFSAKKTLNRILLSDPDEYLDIVYPLRKTKGRKPTLSESMYPVKHGNQDVFWAIPSSPYLVDVEDIVPTLAQEPHLHFYANRMAGVIAKAAEENHSAVIVDLPPGLIGFSEAMLGLTVDEDFRDRVEGILSNDCKKRPSCLFTSFVVTTPDPSDYRAAVPNFLALCCESKNKIGRAEDNADEKDASSPKESPGERDKEQHDPIQIWVNKVRGDIPDTMERIFAECESILSEQERVDPYRNLSEQQDKCHKELLKEIRGKTTEDRSLPYVEDFNMTKIVSAALAFVEMKRTTPEGNLDGMISWLGSLGKQLKIIPKAEDDDV